MSRSGCLVLAAFILAGSAFGSDEPLWKEYGLVHTQAGKQRRLAYTAYRMKDLTGALAAWEWQRSPAAKSCDLAPFCTADLGRTIIFDNNYVVIFESANPKKIAVDAVLQSLPDKKDTALPAIVTFLPRQGRVPDSARYVLGKVSLKAFAPELSTVEPGFDQGAEAQVAAYRIDNATNPVRLALFYYATPEMARLHTVEFRLLPNTHVKRSGVLIAIVYGGATEQEADTVLSRVEYEAKITWNDVPPPGPIKPLYQLLLNILYLSIVLSGICFLAGLIYAGMRIYRRRYGTLEADEAMTTLHLTSE
jgi:hypothetical protein